MTKSVQFLQEELALMSYYDRSSRRNLIDTMSNVLPYVEDLTTADYMTDALDKLRRITDEQFAALDFSQAHDIDTAS